MRIQHSILNCLALSILLCAGIARGDEPPANTIETTATGKGTTAEEARKDAMITAVRQALPTLIAGKTMVANDKIVNEILNVSEGYIDKQETLIPISIDSSGVYVVTIKAWIKREKLAGSVAEHHIALDAQVVPRVDPNERAREEIAKDQKENAMKVLLEHTKGMYPTMLRTRILDDQGRVVRAPRLTALPNGGVDCLWNIEVSVDAEAYRAASIKLRMLLDAVVDQQHRGGFAIKTPEKRTLHPPEVYVGELKTFANGHLLRWLDYKDVARIASAVPKPAEGQTLLAVYVPNGLELVQQSYRWYLIDTREFAAISANLCQPVSMEISVMDQNKQALAQHVTALDHTDLMPDDDQDAVIHKKWGAQVDRNDVPVVNGAMGYSIPMNNETYPSTFVLPYSAVLVTPEFQTKFSLHSPTIARFVADTLVFRYKTVLAPAQAAAIKDLDILFVAHKK